MTPTWKLFEIYCQSKDRGTLLVFPCLVRDAIWPGTYYLDTWRCPGSTYQACTTQATAIASSQIGGLSII